MFGSSKITDIGSVTPPTGNPTVPNSPAPLASFPVDLTIPLFQDDFNRPDELLTTNPKWTSFMGESGFISNQEVTTDIGGAYLLPNKPSFFPSLDKVYLESSIKMDGSSSQSYAILPYSDLVNFTGAYGCMFSFESESLVISAGDLMGIPTVLATLSNYPAEVTSYVGCEVEQTSGVIKAYLNSNFIGKLEGLNLPSTNDSTPFMYAQGTGNVVDDVKAFNSFEEGRSENTGDLRIYNTPYANYSSSTLSAFYLQGYCKDNGATIQAKDSQSGGFESGVVTCSSNQFRILLNLTDLTRFPLGLNQLRIEYTNSSITTEYFWFFKRIVNQPTINVSGPNPSTISLNGAATYTLTYDSTFDVNSINVQASDVIFGMNSTGCYVDSISGTSYIRTVVIKGCNEGSYQYSASLFLKSNTAQLIDGSPARSVAFPSLTVDNSIPSGPYQITLGGSPLNLIETPKVDYELAVDGSTGNTITNYQIKIVGANSTILDWTSHTPNTKVESLNLMAHTAYTIYIRAIGDYGVFGNEVSTVYQTLSNPVDCVNGAPIPGDVCTGGTLYLGVQSHVV